MRAVCSLVGAALLLSGAFSLLDRSSPSPAVAHAYVFNSQLDPGDRGADVSALQQTLKDLAFYTYPDITGFFGPVTQAALEAFQRAMGIASLGTPETTGYGRVGPQTRSAINARSTATTAGEAAQTGSVSAALSRDLSLGTENDDVKRLQQFLNENGFSVSVDGPGSPGNETTYFGPATQAALARFQAAHGIAPAAGYFGPLSRGKITELTFAAPVPETTPRATSTAATSSLPAPERLHLSTTNSRVRISWHEVDDATSYNVKRREVPGEWVTIASVSRLEYTDTNISESTTYSYHITAANDDGESALSVEASTKIPRSGGGQSGGQSVAPVNTAVPTISGTATVGDTLTASTGTWTSDPEPTYTYQWKRDSVSILEATTSTYELTAEDVDTEITVTVTATNSAGSASATSGLVEALFSPVILFQDDEQGVIYDVSDLTSMFQDSAGTIPAVVDSPVGRINDLSGNGNHAVQATDTQRPILRQDNSGYYLESDGVDDALAVAFTITQPWTRISLLDQRTWENTRLIFSGIDSSVGGLWERGTAAPHLQIYSGSFMAEHTGEQIQQNTPALIFEVHNGASSKLGVNQNPVQTGNANTSLPGGISLFSRGTDFAFPSQSRIYGVVEIDRELTDLEIEQVQWWLTRDKTRVLVIDGDSNSWNTISYGYQYIPNANPAPFIHFLAVPGTGFDTNSPGDLALPARVSQMDARIPSNKRGQQYVYFPWWSNNAPTGGNYLDLQTPRTQAQFAAAVAVFLQERKAAGWDKVCIGTLVERTDAGQDNTATRHAYNDIISAPGWIEANGIDCLVDFAAHPIVGADGASLDTDLVSDGVHFTTLGHSYLEEVFRAAIEALPD